MFQVTNNGEDNAFLSELSVTLPRNIIFNRRQPIGKQKDEDVSHIKCITKQEEDFTNKVICSLSNELLVGESEVFGLSVITTNIEDLSQKTLSFDFFAYVQEPSEELSKLPLFCLTLKFILFKQVYQLEYKYVVHSN